MAELKLEDWLPMSLMMGPPLPAFLKIYWPWYKKEEVPPEVPPTGAYGCPYCEQSFDTLKELIDHVASAHKDKPPLGEIDIQWA